MTQALALDGLSLIARQPSGTGASDQAPNPEAALVARAQLDLILDVSLARFQGQGNTEEIMGDLTLNLHRLRRELDRTTWQALTARCQSHGICAYLFQDPLTKWSFDKPRGYSGDAHLLDLIYGHSSIDHEITAASALGRAIYAHTSSASSSVAVRERLSLLAKTIDAAAARRDEPIAVLSVASGHLREATLSKALAEGQIDRWIALDQDPISIGTVTSTCASPVEAINGSVRSLLGNRHAIGTFDLVYAAGLFDYLEDPVAVRVARKCLQMLKPGGSFFFANFSDETKVDGYLEAFMDWPLLLRSETDMHRIAQLTADGKANTDIFFGANRDVVYCEIKAID